MNLQSLTDLLAGFVSGDRGGLVPGTDARMFVRPLIGIAAVDDPQFETLCHEDVAGRHHLLPAQWLDGARSVISFFLPISPEVCRSNQRGSQPSMEWTFTRFYGEEFSRRLRTILVETIEQDGHRAVVPSTHPEYRTVGMNASWSERHVGFVAGLGTFGLNTGFITEKGMAGRLGSVITTLDLEPTSRPYDDHHAYCLWFSGQGCGDCLRRCPAGALSADGKDRQRCADHLVHDQGRIWRLEYGFPYSPCGKCYVGVPCATARPRVESGADAIGE